MAMIERAIESPPPPRLAATVMLLRDGVAGLEVLLLKRHDRSDVHGGVYVFPGGKVDDADYASALARFGECVTLQRRFRDDAVNASQAAVLHFAAARELAEECGVVIGDIDSIHPHSRWITPVMNQYRKRFDTWFFVALLPLGASAHHDGHEAVESIWISPRDALNQYWHGHIALAPPQIMSLVALARHAKAQHVLDAARAHKPVCVQPEQVGQDDVVILAYPGDPEHSVGGPSIPGPSRLVLRGSRYEPVLGFDAFFS